MQNTLITNSVDKELEQEFGYSLQFQLTQKELIKILGFINDQWIAKIKEKYPQHWKKFSEIGIARYHELTHLIDHGATWEKKSRMFSKEMAFEVREMSFIKSLEAVYGPIEIVDEENIGYEEFDWRLVRPQETQDIGPLHADKWFRDLGHGVNPPNDKKAIKIWVAICCEPGLNGLRVVPNSQKRDWRYHGEYRHSFVKPQIDEDENSLRPILLPTKPGDAVIFHEKLLHGGALNQGKYTRISMEFMAFVRTMDPA